MGEGLCVGNPVPFLDDQIRQIKMHLKIISSSAEQEKILLEVTQVIATKWEDTMDMELSDIQGMDPKDYMINMI